MTQQAVVLDLDGTLVDSVHHHVTAWHRALVTHGHDDVPMVRVHAGVGMGSDRLLPWLLGGPVDEDEFDAISDRHGELFRAVADDLRATRGAAALLDDLARREVPHVIATSADPDERELLLRALARTWRWWTAVTWPAPSRHPTCCWPRATTSTSTPGRR